MLNYYVIILFIVTLPTSLFSQWNVARLSSPLNNKIVEASSFNNEGKLLLLIDKYLVEFKTSTLDYSIIREIENEKFLNKSISTIDMFYYNDSYYITTTGGLFRYTDDEIFDISIRDEHFEDNSREYLTYSFYNDKIYLATNDKDIYQKDTVNKITVINKNFVSLWSLFENDFNLEWRFTNGDSAWTPVATSLSVYNEKPVLGLSTNYNYFRDSVSSSIASIENGRINPKREHFSIEDKKIIKSVSQLYAKGNKLFACYKKTDGIEEFDGGIVVYEDEQPIDLIKLPVIDNYDIYRSWQDVKKIVEYKDKLFFITSNDVFLYDKNKLYHLERFDFNRNSVTEQELSLMRTINDVIISENGIFIFMPGGLILFNKDFDQYLDVLDISVEEENNFIQLKNSEIIISEFVD